MTTVIVQTAVPTPGANVYLTTAAALTRINERFKTTVTAFPALTDPLVQDELWVASTLIVEIEAAIFLFNNGAPISTERDTQTLLWGRIGARDHHHKDIVDPLIALQSWSDACILYAEELAESWTAGTSPHEPADHAGEVETAIHPEQAELRERYTAEGKPDDWFFGRDLIRKFLSESFPPGACA